jgi:hypothetical protein
MGMSGEDYDRYSGDFTPNKNRRMAEWRAKRKQQDADSLQRKMDILHGRAEPNKYGNRSQEFHEAHGKEDQMPTTLFDNLGNPNF